MSVISDLISTCLNNLSAKRESDCMIFQASSAIHDNNIIIIIQETESIVNYNFYFYEIRYVH